MTLVAKEVHPDERFVMESLVAHLGGVWEPGEDPPDAYLLNTSGRIAVEVSTLTQHVEPPGKPAMPRIGQDAAVIDLVNALDQSLRPKVKGDRYAILVLRSPLENLRKFKRQLASHVELTLAAGEDVTENMMIAGNDVKISTHTGERPSGKRVVAVIPNRLSSPCISQNATDILRDRIEDKALKMREIAKSHTSWLTLLNDYWLADADTYRAAIHKLAIGHPFRAIYLVSRQGRVHRLD